MGRDVQSSSSKRTPMMVQPASVRTHYEQLHRAQSPLSGRRPADGISKRKCEGALVIFIAAVVARFLTTLL